MDVCNPQRASFQSLFCWMALRKLFDKQQRRHRQPVSILVLLDGSKKVSVVLPDDMGANAVSILVLLDGSKKVNPC